MYLWLKAFHIISVITWFAGIFYLPRLFVYHAACKDEISIERFKVMEHKLYRLIMMPSMVIKMKSQTKMGLNLLKLLALRHKMIRRAMRVRPTTLMTLVSLMKSKSLTLLTQNPL